MGIDKTSVIVAVVFTLFTTACAGIELNGMNAEESSQQHLILAVKADGYFQEPLANTQTQDRDTSKYNDHSNINEVPESHIPHKKHSSQSLVVKGIYIGMNINEVQSVLRTKIDTSKVSVADVSKGDGGKFPNALTGPENYYIALGGLFPIGVILAGPDGAVDYIMFSEILVNNIFKAQGAPAVTFAQQFINAYGIPEIKLSDDRRSWFYLSPDGVKLTITVDKDVYIERISSEAERRDAFN